MLGWALTFLGIALVSAPFGFTGIAMASAGIARLIFFVFLALAAAALLARLLRKRPGRCP